MKYNIIASYSDRDKSANANLWLISFKEDNVHIIYSPALDLSGSGYTEKEAMNSFSIALEEFIRYTLNKGTIFRELRRLGWRVGGSKRHPKFQSPNLSEMVSENKELEHLLANKEFKKFDREINIPAFA